MSSTCNKKDINDCSVNITDHSNVMNLIKQAIGEFEDEIDKQKRLLSDLQVDTDTLDLSVTRKVTEISSQAVLANSLNSNDLDSYYLNKILNELKLEKQKWEIEQKIFEQSQKNDKLQNQVQDLEKELEKAKHELVTWSKTDKEHSKLKKKINELSSVVEICLKNNSTDFNIFEMNEEILNLIELRNRKESLLKQISKYKGFSSDIIEATSQIEDLKAKLISLN